VVVAPGSPATVVDVVVSAGWLESGGAVVVGSTWARAGGAATVSNATTGTRIQRSRNMTLSIHRPEGDEV
jgi:hypothetical protein